MKLQAEFGMLSNCRNLNIVFMISDLLYSLQFLKGYELYLLFTNTVFISQVLVEKKVKAVTSGCEPHKVFTEEENMGHMHLYVILISGIILCGKCMHFTSIYIYIYK